MRLKVLFVLQEKMDVGQFHFCPFFNCSQLFSIQPRAKKTLFHVKKKLIKHLSDPKDFFQTILWSNRQFSMWLCIGILSSGSKSIPTTILGMSRIKPNKAYQTGTEMKKKKNVEVTIKRSFLKGISLYLHYWHTTTRSSPLS